MTPERALAEVVAAAVRADTAPLLARCAALEVQIVALEARAPVPGPQGAKGDPGARGDVGANGRDGTDGLVGPQGERGSDAAVGPLAEEMAALDRTVRAFDARLAATDAAQLSDDDLTALCEDLTRKTFSALPPIAPVLRMQKRVIRDRDGKIQRIIEEPIAP